MRSIKNDKNMIIKKIEYPYLKYFTKEQHIINNFNNITDLASVIAPTAGGGARTMRRRRYHGKRRDKRKLTARRHKK